MNWKTQKPNKDYCSLDDKPIFSCGSDRRRIQRNRHEKGTGVRGQFVGKLVNCSLHVVDFMGYKNTLNYVLWPPDFSVLFSANCRSWSRKRHEIAILKPSAGKTMLYCSDCVRLGSASASGASGTIAVLRCFLFAANEIPFNDI